MFGGPERRFRARARRRRARATPRSPNPRGGERDLWNRARIFRSVSRRATSAGLMTDRAHFFADHETRNHPGTVSASGAGRGPVPRSREHPSLRECARKNKWLWGAVPREEPASSGLLGSDDTRRRELQDKVLEALGIGAASPARRAAHIVLRQEYHLGRRPRARASRRIAITTCSPRP